MQSYRCDNARISQNVTVSDCCFQSVELHSQHTNIFEYGHQTVGDPSSLFMAQNLRGFGMHCPEERVTNSIIAFVCLNPLHHAGNPTGRNDPISGKCH